MGRDVDGRLTLSTVTGSCSLAWSSPWEESRRSIVVEANDRVGEENGAFEEQDDGKDDEERHRHKNAGPLL